MNTIQKIRQGVTYILTKTKYILKSVAKLSTVIVILQGYLISIAYCLFSLLLFMAVIHEKRPLHNTQKAMQTNTTEYYFTDRFSHPYHLNQSIVVLRTSGV